MEDASDGENEEKAAEKRRQAEEERKKNAHDKAKLEELMNQDDDGKCTQHQGLL
jgi:hypothetical protein